MAAEDIYAAALGDYYKQIAGNNPWANAQVQVPGNDPESGFWSNFLAPVASRLAEGLMRGYGNQQVKKEQSEYKNDLLNIMSQPPEKRADAFASDPRFADLQIQERLQQQKQQREYEQKIKEAGDIARITAREKAIGERQAQPIVDYNTSPGNPMNLPEKQRELLVPGIGYALNPKNAEALTTGDESFKSALAALNTVRELRKAVGVENINSNENAAAESAVTDFLFKIKQAEQAGSLDKGLVETIAGQIPTTGLKSDSLIPGMGLYEKARNAITGDDPVLATLDQTEKQLLENYQNKLKGRLGNAFVNPDEYTKGLQGSIGGNVRQDLANRFPSVKESQSPKQSFLGSLPVVGDYLKEPQTSPPPMNSAASITAGKQRYVDRRNPATGEIVRFLVND